MELTAERVLSISGQGSIYIRPVDGDIDVSEDNEDDDQYDDEIDEAEELVTDPKAKKVRVDLSTVVLPRELPEAKQGQSSSSLSQSGSSSSSTTNTRSAGKVFKLKEIFPKF